MENPSGSQPETRPMGAQVEWTQHQLWTGTDDWDCLLRIAVGTMSGVIEYVVLQAWTQVITNTEKKF